MTYSYVFHWSPGFFFFFWAGLWGGELIKKRVTNEGIPGRQMNELNKRQVADGRKSILLIFPAPSEEPILQRKCRKR